MMRRHFSRESGARRGQVIILGAMMVLFLTMALMMTMGITWAVRERIRVQNAADANAYSSAVQVARAYNYFAYSNRAIAAAYVSMTILSAYHSEISAAADAYWSVAFDYFAFVGGEIAKGCCGTCLWSCCPCLCWQHCKHAIEDGITAAKFIGAASELADDIQSLDQPFTQAISAWEKMIQSLESSQTDLKTDIAARLEVGGVSLGDINVPHGTAGSVALGELNRNHFNAAIDTATSSKKQRDMTDMVNASRPDWTWQRGTLDYLPSLAFTSKALKPLGDKIRRQAGAGNAWTFAQVPLAAGGQAGMTAGESLSMFSDAPPDPGDSGDTIGAQDWWTAGGKCKHNCIPGGFVAPFLGPFAPAKVYTNKDGGDHEWGLFNDPCSGTNHNQMNVTKTRKYLSYKGKREANWNMPAIYGYASKSLDTNEAGHRQPFYMTSSGKFSNLLYGTNHVSLVDDSESKAVSKALVYYHRQGDWKEPPNFFNPFWRVKLHPFSNSEFSVVSGAALDPSGAVVSNLGIGTATTETAMAP